MANLSKYLTDSKVESYFESAIFDSRFIKGSIDAVGVVTISKKENEKLRMKLLEDYYDGSLIDTVYFIQLDNAIIYTYQKDEFNYFISNSIARCFLLEFKELFILLFVNAYAGLIGYRRSLIIANNALYDLTEELIDYLEVSDINYARFLQGKYSLEREITFNKICDFYQLKYQRRNELKRIKLIRKDEDNGTKEIIRQRN